MDLQERQSALVTELTQLRQAIAEATIRSYRLEGAVALLNEQLKEKDGNTDLSSGAETS